MKLENKRMTIGISRTLAFDLLPIIAFAEARELGGVLDKKLEVSTVLAQINFALQNINIGNPFVLAVKLDFGHVDDPCMKAMCIRDEDFLGLAYWTNSVLHNPSFLL
jgi:hypothetical protein